MTDETHHLEEQDPIYSHGHEDTCPEVDVLALQDLPFFLSWVAVVSGEELIEERQQGVDQDDQSIGVLFEGEVGQQHDESEQVVGQAGHQ